MSKHTKKPKPKIHGDFFQQRMDALGVTPQNNTISLSNPEAEFPVPAVVKMPIFEEDRKGNIAINFCNLDGQLITYYKKGNGKMSALNQKPQVYQQTRLRELIRGNKYLLPQGKGIFPFFPPLILKAWRNKTPIHTLYLTEGAFKAWKSCLFDIFTVGLTSITHYRDSETRALHHDIIRLIIECNVQRVVILWDGDCRNVSENHLRDMVDIAKRPRDFFNTIKGIRKLLLDIELPKGHPDLEICFFHVNPQSFPSAPKGLDDILIEGEKMGNASAVIKELKDKEINNPFFFYKMDITTSTTTLFHYFKLQDVHAFFHFHHEKIKNNRFKFKKDIWEWNEKVSKLELIAPGWVETVKWIGDNFYKIIFVPTADGHTRRELQMISKHTLIDLYGNDFQKHLNHYEGFCNIPNHFNYKSEVNNFYNSYQPLPYAAEPGNCSKTLAFIKHIFGEQIVEHQGKSYVNYELGLDYLQLLLTKPHRALPVLILYSPENNTGKSTFGKWQGKLLGRNAINVSNEDLRSKFNGHWVSKLLIYCEETFLEKESDLNIIKSMSTNSEATTNRKGVQQYISEFFGKFQFYSNNKKMVHLNKHDERYWIRQVPLPKEDNPDLLEELVEEIPAFLHFIKNRKMLTKRQGRMHFHIDLIRTSTFYETVKISEPTDVKNLRENIKMMFLDFGQQQILLPLKAINLEFFGNKASLYRLREILTDYLLVKQLRTTNGVLKQVRSEYYRWERDINKLGQESMKKRTIKFKGRPYVFNRADFISKDDEFEDGKIDG